MMEGESVPRPRVPPMSQIPPVVRQFVPCRGLTCDTTMTPNRYSLIDPFHVLRPPPGANYPLRYDELWVFSQLTNATGPHDLTIDLSWDLDAEVRPLRTFRVLMGADRLGVRNFAVRLHRVPFRRPGIYEFRLSSAGRLLARSPFRLEAV